MSSMRSASSRTANSTARSETWPAAHEVEQAAGSGDDDVDAAADGVDLRALADAAEDRGATDAHRLAEGADVLIDLRGELARRRDDERARVTATERISTSRSRIGRTNAAVLPVPVCAMPMRSRPARTGGMAAVWIGVGVRVADVSDGLQKLRTESECKK